MYEKTLTDLLDLIIILSQNNLSKTLELNICINEIISKTEETKQQLQEGNNIENLINELVLLGKRLEKNYILKNNPSDIKNDLNNIKCFIKGITTVIKTANEISNHIEKENLLPYNNLIVKINTLIHNHILNSKSSTLDEKLLTMFAYKIAWDEKICHTMAHFYYCPSDIPNTNDEYIIRNMVAEQLLSLFLGTQKYFFPDINDLYSYNTYAIAEILTSNESVRNTLICNTYTKKFFDSSRVLSHNLSEVFKFLSMQSCWNITKTFIDNLIKDYLDNPTNQKYSINSEDNLIIEKIKKIICFHDKKNLEEFTDEETNQIKTFIESNNSQICINYMINLFIETTKKGV